jgi:ABC-type sugar transport system substrate-binding protein
VVALLVYALHTSQDWPAAHAALQDARRRGVPLTSFVDAAVVEDVYRAVGVDPVEAGVLPPALG